MANPEHVKIVKKGKEAIAAWWEAYPSEGLDLRRAHLEDADLRGADLEGADLTYAHLEGAHLEDAILAGAHLKSAHLEGAHLRGADLGSADLTYAHLEDADLRGANLARADLWRAHLEGADLEYAILAGAHLEDAILGRTNLRGAHLRSADLEGAHLGGAHLGGAHLGGAILIRTILDGATITDACLWETQRAGWRIKGITCEAIYWDKERKKPTQYAPGEFERLYADTFKIKLRYEGGIDLIEIATLPTLIKQIEDNYPGCALRFQTIQEDAGGASVTIAIDNLGEYDFEVLEATAQQSQSQLRLALKENERLRGTLNHLTYELIPTIVRACTTQISVGGNVLGNLIGGNLIGTASLIEGNYMTEHHIHGGHFQGCSFGDHNSLTNYFGVVDKLGTVEEDIKQRLKEARKAIENSKLPADDKADLVEQLNNLTAELEKPERDDSQIKRYWNRIKEIAPTVASLLASAASLAKLLGGG